jgi:hypothetical protein
MLKWPLIIAAFVVVMRVIVERAGVPESISNLFSVVALHLVIVPLYFSIRIGLSTQPRPYVTQIKLVTSFVILARVMVIPTYWLAHILGWQQRRFGGLGADTAPFAAYITIPFATAAMWIVASVVVGSALGSVVIAVISLVRRRQSHSAAL